MNKKILVFSAIALSAITFAQTGVGVMTENPQGTFHVDAAGDNPATGAPAGAQQRNDVVVLSNGNVGIGTTTPNAKLEIAGLSGSNSIKITGGPWTTFGAENTVAGTAFSYFASTGGLGFKSGAAVVDASPTDYDMVVRDGNVGIGTTAPAYQLDVTGDINASGSVRAAGVALTSDARLKTNIVPMNNGLNTVMRLNPVSYDKKASLASTDYNTHEYGFLAQELQKVLPTLVGEGNDAGHTLSVNYVAIIPVLVKAIQEQQAQIEALKAKK